jgi:HEAT repeat protein
VEPLIKALEEDKDDSGHVQACIAKALGNIRDPRAVEPLIKQLNERNTLWWKIKWAEIQEWSKNKRTREKIALPMRQHLETGIRHGVQIRAIQALGEIRDTKAIEPLIKKLGDPLHEIWQAAAEALGKMGEPAVESLIQALKDEKWDVRTGAARSLGGIGDNKAVDPLIQALKDRNLTVRIHATEALVKIGEPAVESLTRTLINEKMTTDSLKYVKKALEKIRHTNKNKPA